MTAEVASEQMTNLLRRYGVRTERQLIRAVRDDVNVETDAHLTLRDAEGYLDQMLEAEYQRIAGGAYDRPREDTPEMTTETMTSDPRLNDPKFVDTDEGQALLEAQAAAAAEARRAARKATNAAKAEAAQKRAAEAEAARAPGKIEIVKPAAEGKASRVARRLKADVPRTKAERMAERALAGEAKAKPTKTGPPAAKVAKVAKPKAIVNRPLNLGDVIEIDGVKYQSIRHRDGSLAEHQTDNAIWRCGTCGRRLRDATCVGTFKGGGEPHRAVKAPAGYRRESRIVN